MNTPRKLSILRKACERADIDYALESIQSVEPRIAGNYHTLLKASDKEVAGTYLWTELHLLLEQEQENLKHQHAKL